MKKKLSLALALVFATSVGSTAMAASTNPFTDVPVSNWSYGAVNKLAKAGIVDGYNDGTFKGDKSVTRYEMATIIVKALGNYDKANAEQKAALDKLSSEYASELQALGAHVYNLEKKVGNVTFSGSVRARYEDTQKNANTAGQSAYMTRVRVNMAGALDDNWSFGTRIEYNAQNNHDGVGNNGTTNFSQAYVAGKVLGADAVILGRYPLFLGQGLVLDGRGSDVWNAPNIAGVAFHVDKVNFVVGTGDIAPLNTVAVGTGSAVYPNLRVTAANISAPVFDGLTLTASYLKNNDSGAGTYLGVAIPTFNALKTTSFGLNYTGIQNLTFTGEWGKNSSELAKWVNGATNGSKSAPRAYFYQMKYKGAEKTQVGTFGIWTGYRNFEPGFDPANLTTLDFTGNTLGANNETLYLSGLKGMEYGAEYTLFKNGVLSLRYQDFKTIAKAGTALTPPSNTHKKSIIGQLEVSF